MNNQIYENRIKCLKYDLYHSELEIARLYKEREISEQEILALKSQLSILVIKIRHLEEVANNRENFITYREKQILEEFSILHEEISQLKHRISELLAKNSIMSTPITRELSSSSDHEYTYNTEEGRRINVRISR